MKKNRKSVLMITPYLPCPSQSGGQTRSFYLIKHLSKTCDLTVICFTRGSQGLEDLRPYCKKIIVVERGKTWNFKNILSTGISTYPFLVTNYISKELQQQIELELSNGSYDLIHTECFYLMPNIPKTSLPIVLVDQTIEYAVYQHYTETLTGIKKLLKPLLSIDVLKIKYWEKYYWKSAHTLAVVSEDDKKVIEHDTGRKDVQIIPNGVDMQYFSSKRKTTKTKNPSILFGISNMTWMQNSEGAKLLLENVWPKIKKEVKNCQLFIIGRHAPTKFAKVNDPQVTIREADKDGHKNDPLSYYQRSWLLVAPIQSGHGSRTKFFEAMAAGLPIVTTRQGMEGIEISNMTHAAVVPFTEVAETSIKLLNSAKKREELGKQARTLVAEKYSWEKSAQDLELLYNKIS